MNVSTAVKMNDGVKMAVSAVMSNAKDFGPWKVARIPVELLELADYQRSESNTVKTLAQRWDDKKCDPLRVSFRDGRFWVYDGQHRLGAAKILGKEDMLCVITELSCAEEALTFAEQDDNRKAVTALEKLNARAIAGEEDAKGLLAICCKMHVELVNSRRPAIGKCGCVNKLTKIYKAQGADAIMWIFETIKMLHWDHAQFGYSGCVLAAIYSVYKNADNKDDLRKRIVDMVGNQTPRAVLAQAMRHFPGRGVVSALTQHFLSV